MTKIPTKTESTMADREAFHAMVGQGISAWTIVESDIVRIAAVLLGTTEKKTGLIFYSILNFNTWLTIVSELFLLDPTYKQKPSIKLRKRWGKIAEKAKPLYDTRSRLAHHTIYGPNMFSDLGLMPSHLDTRTKSKQYAPLTADQIADFVEDSAKLWTALEELRKSLFQPPPSPEKS